MMQMTGCEHPQKAVCLDCANQLLAVAVGTRRIEKQEMADYDLLRGEVLALRRIVDGLLPLVRPGPPAPEAK